MSSNSSSRVLLMEFNKLTKEPVEGFEISLKNEDIYHWMVVIFGPPKTLYEGGYFKAEMTFPPDYPYRYFFSNFLPFLFWLFLTLDGQIAQLVAI